VFAMPCIFRYHVTNCHTGQVVQTARNVCNHFEDNKSSDFYHPRNAVFADVILDRNHKLHSDPEKPSVIFYDKSGSVVEELYKPSHY